MGRMTSLPQNSKWAHAEETHKLFHRQSDLSASSSAGRLCSGSMSSPLDCPPSAPRKSPLTRGYVAGVSSPTTLTQERDPAPSQRSQPRPSTPKTHDRRRASAQGEDRPA